MENKYNILIADDEKEIISVLRLLLEKENICVYEAYDGEMAYMIMQRYDIDMAIIDIMMPRMNGYELLRKMRKEYEIPVMIILPNLLAARGCCESKSSFTQTYQIG